jgi:hypothetical protein
LLALITVAALYQAGGVPPSASPRPVLSLSLSLSLTLSVCGHLSHFCISLSRVFGLFVPCIPSQLRSSSLRQSRSSPPTLQYRPVRPTWTPAPLPTPPPMPPPTLLPQRSITRSAGPSRKSSRGTHPLDCSQTLLLPPPASSLKKKTICCVLLLFVILLHSLIRCSATPVVYATPPPAASVRSDVRNSGTSTHNLVLLLRRDTSSDGETDRTG